MTGKKEDKEIWFRSMWNCKLCMTEATNYKECEFHKRGAKLLGLVEKEAV